jgi:hypothetical protein
MFSAGINNLVPVAGGHEAGGAFSGHLQGVQGLQMDLEAQFPVLLHRFAQSGFIGGKLLDPAFFFQFLVSAHRIFLPGMRDGSRLAGGQAGKRRPIDSRFAGAAGVFEFFTFRFFNDRHRSRTERIVGVLIPDLKGPRRTDRNAVATTMAFIRIQADEKFPRSVLISIMGNHVFLLLPKGGYWAFSASALANRAAPKAPAIWVS